MIVLVVPALLALGAIGARCQVDVPLGVAALLSQFEMDDIGFVKGGGLNLTTADRYSSWFQMMDGYRDLGRYDQLQLEIRGPQQLQFVADLGVRFRPRSVSRQIHNVRFRFGSSLIQHAAIRFSDIPGFDRNVSTIYDLTLSEFLAPNQATVSVWLKAIRLVGDSDACPGLKSTTYSSSYHSYFITGVITLLVVVWSQIL